MSRPHTVLELFRAPENCLGLSTEDRAKFVDQMTKSTRSGPFPSGVVDQEADMPWYQELFVAILFGLLIGGTFLLIGVGILILVSGTWIQFFLHCALVLFLAFHPLGDVSRPNQWLASCRFTVWLYRYFSIRFVWSNDDFEQVKAAPAWIGAGPPHGVLPVANLLSMPAINVFAFRQFVGAPASVVFNTPFLRYMCMFGCVSVGRKSIAKAVKSGRCVGMVPDGIAGLFQTNAKDEIVSLANRKGLAKLSLRNGIPIVPAYSIGNTQAFSAWFDSFGIMESLSRKLRVTLFIPIGRWGLPIPRRTKISLLFGKPIVPPVLKEGEQPTQKQIDVHHAALLAGIKELFDRHKTELGYGHREIKFA